MLHRALGSATQQLVRRSVFFGLISFLLLTCSALGSPPLTKVSLQLKWRHQFQFAGYYAAQAKGFYRDAGLDVHIVEGNENHPPIKEVLEGRADFGVSDADVLLCYLQGKPLVGLGAVFQHSPYILMARADSGIRTPSDLRGRTVMLDDEQGLVQIKAIFKREGIPFSTIRVVPHVWENRELIDRRVDAVSAYSTVEPFQLRAQGVEPVVIRAMDYGLDFYGDNLFTTRNRAEQDPEQVEAFRRASFQGWEYAMAHPDELMDLILKMPGVTQRGITRDQLRHEADAMRELILPDLVDVGHMNPGRWEMIARVYADIGLIPQAPKSVDSFLFNPQPEAYPRWLTPLLATVGMLTLIGTWILLRNLRLRRLVAQRTAELHRSHERLARAEDVSLVMALHVSLDGRWLKLPPTFVQFLGYVREEELLGHEFREVTHPDDFQADWDQCQRLIRGRIKSFEMEKRFVRRDGSITWGYLNCSIVTDESGEPVHFLTYVRDINEQKQAEAACRASEQRFRILAQSATRLLMEQRPEQLVRELFDNLAAYMGMEVYCNFLLTEDGQRLRLNASAGVDKAICCRLEYLEFGQAICGTVAQKRTPVVAEDVQRSDEPSWDMIRQLGLKAYICHPLLARGRLVGTLSFGTRNRDRFSEEELGLLRAVCDQVAVALERQRLAEELDRRATDLTIAKASAEQAKAAAEKASRAKDHFLAVLSHELRTPLTPVLTAVQMMEEEPGLSEDTRETLTMIRRNVALETRLIDDLLDLTRLSRGKLALHVETVSLHEKVRHAVHICEDDARTKSLDLRVELAADSPRVQADPARLQQIIWNLLRNAIKFTPVGGSIQVRTANRKPGWVEVVVEDTGVGIDPDLLPRIFNPFEQGGPDVTRLFGGMGLGLSITKALVDLHGGKITAFSEGKGRGATFRLELPLSTLVLEKPQPERADGNGQTACRSGRILLVEDHADTSVVLSRLLRRWGYDVTTAGSVAAGLRTAQAATFDLLISDLGLPDGTGHDLMRQIARVSPLKGIALSGYGQEEDIRRSQAAGFVEHMVKPVDFTQLREMVTRLTQATGDSSETPGLDAPASAAHPEPVYD